MDFEELRDTGRTMAAYLVGTLWQSSVHRQTETSDKEERDLLSTYLSGLTAQSKTLYLN